jgi:predicted HicB family RNase H-like nuclease
MRPGKPARAVRVEDELWEAALAKAVAEGTTVSDVIRKALKRYVAR